jgi:hypothetical protein
VAAANNTNNWKMIIKVKPDLPIDITPPFQLTGRIPGGIRQSYRITGETRHFPRLKKA